MATYTSTLPDNLLKELAKTSKDLKMPKNKIIEKAVAIYLEHLDRAAYLKSYKRMAKDEDIIKMAEEGMTDYYNQLLELDKE